MRAYRTARFPNPKGTLTGILTMRKMTGGNIFRYCENRIMAISIARPNAASIQGRCIAIDMKSIPSPRGDETLSSSMLTTTLREFRRGAQLLCGLLRNARFGSWRSGALIDANTVITLKNSIDFLAALQRFLLRH